METTATYDKNTQEFIINSPNFQSQKYWPGNIAEYGMFATVFARLIIDNKGLLFYCCFIVLLFCYCFIVLLFYCFIVLIY